MNQSQARYYLAAIIDGEGSVYVCPNRYRSRVIISNTEEDILQRVEQALNILQVPFSRYLSSFEAKKTNPCYAISIQQKHALKRVLREVPLASTRKLEKLKVACKEHNKVPCSSKVINLEVIYENACL